MWNFHGSSFLALELPRGVTQFCRISRGEALFSLKFPRVKVTNIKIPGVLSKKHVFIPPVWIFSGLPVFHGHAWKKGSRDIRTVISSDNIQLPQCYFVTYRKKL